MLLNTIKGYIQVLYLWLVFRGIESYGGVQVGNILALRPIIAKLFFFPRHPVREAPREKMLLSYGNFP